MGWVRVRGEPVPALERLLEACRGERLTRLRAVLVCTFTFHSGYFQQFLDALAECHPEGAEYIRSIPIDVVCDHRHYRGHSGAYNVRCWQGDGLFHPKLVLLLFSDRTVWIEGSLNFTRDGYTSNREVATCHEADRRLPHGVRELTRYLAAQGVEAAQEIIRATKSTRTDRANRSVTSLDTSLLLDFIGRTRKAHSVYLVAPFFDQRERAGPSIEAAALSVLANNYRSAAFRIFLPQFERPGGETVLQGSKGLFAQVFGAHTGDKRVAFRGVPSDERPMHAKILAVRHGKSGSRATVLTGSPNLTESALLKRGTKANVELARELSMKWRDVEELFRPLGRTFKKLADCNFEPPKPLASVGWHVLKSATYDPLRCRLQVEWRMPAHARQTLLYYAGVRLTVPTNGRVERFGIRNGELRIKTVCRENSERWSWCPIVIPFRCRLSLSEMPDQGEPPPEWWLAQLGALPGSTTNGEVVRGDGKGESQPDAAAFLLGERIRDLADRMRYALSVLTDGDGGGAERVKAHRDLLIRIFDAHDPSSAEDPTEQIWRTWVRLEVTQTVASAFRAAGITSRVNRRLVADLRQRLSDTVVTPGLDRHWHALLA